jgi:hypothetical protein
LGKDALAAISASENGSDALLNGRRLSNSCSVAVIAALRVNELLRFDWVALLWPRRACGRRASIRTG